MNLKAIISAVLMLTLASSGPAFAQRGGNRDDVGPRGQRQNSRDQRMRTPDRRDSPMFRPDRRYDFQRSQRDNDRWNGRGAGPNHDFRAGERLPLQYRHRQYVVDDWRGHHLSAPPRGYHWVQTGADYVLVAITTGIILQLLLDH